MSTSRLLQSQLPLPSLSPDRLNDLVKQRQLALSSLESEMELWSERDIQSLVALAHLKSSHGPASWQTWQAEEASLLVTRLMKLDTPEAQLQELYSLSPLRLDPTTNAFLACTELVSHLKQTPFVVQWNGCHFQLFEDPTYWTPPDRIFNGALTPRSDEIQQGFTYLPTRVYLCAYYYLQLLSDPALLSLYPRAPVVVASRADRLISLVSAARLPPCRWAQLFDPEPLRDINPVLDWYLFYQRFAARHEDIEAAVAPGDIVDIEDLGRVKENLGGFLGKQKRMQCENCQECIWTSSSAMRRCKEAMAEAGLPLAIWTKFNQSTPKPQSLPIPKRCAAFRRSVAFYQGLKLQRPYYPVYNLIGYTQEFQSPK